MRPSRRHLDAATQLLAPAGLIVLVGVVGSLTSAGTREDFIAALVAVTMVIALHVFIGNSGVISFGHVSFVALGAFSAGVMTIPASVKPTLMPDLFGFLAENDIGNVASLVLAAAVGGLVALWSGIPLMRLSGLAAGIATFAVLEITRNVLRFWEKVGPGAKTLSLVPETTGLLQATVGALIAATVAFVFRRSRAGRTLRASREDPPAAQAIGINIHRQRLLAFTISGALAGFAGGLLVHQLGSITTEQVYLDLTFLTLAMLVVGGASSLWGAVVGALLVSLLDSFLLNAENGLEVGVAELTIPAGSSTVILGAVMALVLIFRPGGLTGGREVSLPRRWRAGPAPPAAGGPSGGPAREAPGAPSAAGGHGGGPAREAPGAPSAATGAVRRRAEREGGGSVGRTA